MGLFKENTNSVNRYLYGFKNLVGLELIKKTLQFIS